MRPNSGKESVQDLAEITQEGNDDNETEANDNYNDNIE